jgi:integrase/recombinase XerC/integrase/recombinase XerD
VDRATLEGKRDHALLAAMVGTGLRGVSLARADRADLTVRGGRSVLAYQGKGRSGKDALKPLEGWVLDALADYLTARGGDGELALFAGIGNRNRGRLSVDRIRRIVSARLDAAGVRREGIEPHSLRHTFATLAFLNGADKSAVQVALDHSSPETTEVYLHGQERLRGEAEAAVSRALGMGS